jgi:S-adenosylmethionine:tRNA ribosyltransferase-isomerase
MRDLYSLSAYLYELPEALIAQHPAEPRDHARLMVVDRSSGEIRTTIFRELLQFFHPGDQIIFNDTRVILARLTGIRSQGGASELFLTKSHPDGTWNALVKPGRKLRAGARIQFEPGFFAEILDVHPNGERLVRFECTQGSLPELLHKHRKLPLPHYIKREAAEKDAESYQTVYADQEGALAAPAAGLHFTREMLQALGEKGVVQTRITLHTGLGTFTPVKSADIREHVMHREQALVAPDAAEQLNRHKTAPLNLCVGTTCCRTLETAASEGGVVSPGEYETGIFIYPGYRFKYVKQLLTNFHAPGSTLLMLVSAFAGYELIQEAYQRAIKERFRFLSYGDAMLIL